MVECGLPKAETRVRFPSPAPLIIKDLHSCAGRVQETRRLFKSILGRKTGRAFLPGQELRLPHYVLRLDDAKPQPFGNSAQFFQKLAEYLVNPEQFLMRPAIPISYQGLRSSLLAASKAFRIIVARCAGSTFFIILYFRRKLISSSGVFVSMTVRSCSNAIAAPRGTKGIWTSGFLYKCPPKAITIFSFSVNARSKVSSEFIAK